MYLTRTAGIETKKMFDEIMQGNQCILPALRELKPSPNTSIIILDEMYLTRTAGIETNGH